MTDFDTDERSASGSRPIDLYQFALPSGTSYTTSYQTDVVYAGQTYTAVTMSRGNEQLAQDVTGRELVVYLPISHPIVQRYAGSGIPERQLLISHYRLQQTSGVAELQSQGFGTGLSIDGRLALIRVPAVTDDAMKIKLPVVAAQRICNHRLGDRQCAPNPGVDGPNLDDVRQPTFIETISSSGTTIEVTGTGGQPTDWATFGDLLHNASGERRFIKSQIGNTITIDVPFVGAAHGDALFLYPGCDHRISTCRDKFFNVPNFGGHAYMTTRINPFLPKGVGVIEQP